MKTLTQSPNMEQLLTQKCTKAEFPNALSYGI